MMTVSSSVMNQPIGTKALAFLRRVSLNGGRLSISTIDERSDALVCAKAGLLSCPPPSAYFQVTPKGQAYLDRLMRCE